MATIELRGVRKDYGAEDIIHGVDLRVEDTEFCVFVGPSGCGKSTLLRMIAGLEEISDGECLIDGERVNEDGPVDRKLAMVFQSYALYPHMTVAQNMGFALRMTGTPKAQAREKVLAAARTLQLDELLDRRPAQLSGGQRQRVAIGRAIVRDPRAFLFDEPLSNLDAELRVQMRFEIAQLHQRLASTMIYVTHDQIEAMTLADKIVVLRAGRVEQVGSPGDLYDDPDNLFVAGFIGSPQMNFVPAVPEAGRLRLPDGSTVDSPVPLETFTSHDPLTLGVRPEHLSFAPGADVSEHGAPRNGGAGNVFRTRVELAENIGAANILHTMMEDGTKVLVEDRTRAGHSIGDVISPGFATSASLVFDGSGNRVRVRGRDRSKFD